MKHVFSIEWLLTRLQAVRPGSWTAFLLAAAIVAAATALHLALAPWLIDTLFTIVLPAVIVTSILCGTSAGFLAVALAAVSVIVFIEAPGTLHRHTFVLGIFVLSSSLMVAIISALRSAVTRTDRLATLLSDAMDASDNNIALYDSEDRLVLINKALKESPGGRAGLFVPGRTYEEIVRTYWSGSEFAKDKDTFERFVAADVEKHQRGDGTRTQQLVGKNMWLVNRDLRTRDGGVLHIATDVSALMLAKQAAEQASTSKSRFLAAASHDLRQPLQTMALLQGLLLRTVSDPQSQVTIDKLGASIESMSDLLNSLLELQQLEAGVVTPNIENFVIGDLLERVCAELRLHAGAKSLDLRYVRCDAEVRSDPSLLELTIRNLISNAIKYTNHGKVLVGCRRHGETLRIEVLDTGIGIAEDQIKFIFEEFRQIDNPTRDRRKGLGLGLSIARRLALLLGHTIEVRAVLHKGSVFSVGVPLGKPLPPPSAEAAESLSPQSAETMDILLVEDNPHVMWSLHALLELFGHRVVATEDADSTLARLREKDWRPDVIVTDFNLPGGMDGVELVKRVRTQLHAATPAVLLTGDVSLTPDAVLPIPDCLLLRKPADAAAIIAAARSFRPDGSPALQRAECSRERK